MKRNALFAVQLRIVAQAAKHGGRCREVDLREVMNPILYLDRTNAWNGRSRRNSKDYERITASSEAMIQISAIHLMLKRLEPSDPPVTFNYRRNQNTTPSAAAA